LLDVRRKAGDVFVDAAGWLGLISTHCLLRSATSVILCIYR
jgi:hypothetical protein